MTKRYVKTWSQKSLLQISQLIVDKTSLDTYTSLLAVYTWAFNDSKDNHLQGTLPYRREKDSRFRIWIARDHALSAALLHTKKNRKEEVERNTLRATPLPSTYAPLVIGPSTRKK